MPPVSELRRRATQTPAARARFLDRVRRALVAANGSVPAAARSLKCSPSTLHFALSAGQYLAELAPLVRKQPQGRPRKDPLLAKPRRARTSEKST